MNSLRRDSGLHLRLHIARRRGLRSGRAKSDAFAVRRDAPASSFHAASNWPTRSPDDTTMIPIEADELDRAASTTGDMRDVVVRQRYSIAIFLARQRSSSGRRRAGRRPAADDLVARASSLCDSIALIQFLRRARRWDEVEPPARDVLAVGPTTSPSGNRVGAAKVIQQPSISFSAAGSSDTRNVSGNV